ncbi:hypothetical protein [Undibacterium sp. TS12]|uniref:hypothetical protein n=1 Tax=Undibacterium sp. TS12 TaxID=2908202 RepID=UPI001F4C79EE|nr:hypothetical protein [Undibacterium sp. TS12]MCH8622633.1 hypothetical protein [Undibacterium sp. TS12]
MSINIDLGIKHHFSTGLYAKEMHLPAQHYALTHKHAYDHVSMLYRGTAKVKVGGIETEYSAPAFVMIRAGEEHTILAVDDVTWFCVHETEETDVEKIDKVAIAS